MPTKSETTLYDSLLESLGSPQKVKSLLNTLIFTLAQPKCDDTKRDLYYSIITDTIISMPEGPKNQAS